MFSHGKKRSADFYLKKKKNKDPPVGLEGRKEMGKSLLWLLKPLPKWRFFPILYQVLNEGKGGDNHHKG